MTFRQRLSNLVASAGNALHLPEMNISERILGRAQASDPTAQYTAEANQLSNLDEYGRSVYVQARLSGLTADEAGQEALLYMESATPNLDMSTGATYPGTSNLFNTMDDGSGTGTGTTAEWVVMNGKQYNLSNATDRLNYFSDRMVLLEQERDAYIADLEKQIGRNLTNAELERDANLASIAQDLADTEAAATNFVADYNKEVSAFGEGKNLGDVKRQQSFSLLAPNAFQSSQSSSQGYANKQFIEGLGDMARNAAENVGTDFLSNPTDYSKLGTNSVLGRQRANLFQEREGVGNTYNTYVADQQEALTRGRKTAQDYVTSSASDLTGQFIGIDKAQGVDPYRYTRSGYTPATLTQADLSRFTPWTTFQNTTPSDVKYGASFKPRTSTNLFSDATPLESYLGNVQLSDSDKQYLRNYLLGRS